MEHTPAVPPEYDRVPVPVESLEATKLKLASLSALSTDGIVIRGMRLLTLNDLLPLEADANLPLPG
jgi:hypothetical protein